MSGTVFFSVVDPDCFQVQYFLVLWIYINLRCSIFQCCGSGLVSGTVFLSVVDPHLFQVLYFSVLWIRIGFYAGPYEDPAFYLNADQNPVSQTNADPDPCQTLKSQKLEFLLDNFSKCTGRRYVKNIPTQVQ
jgi:hypothetical protein